MNHTDVPISGRRRLTASLALLGTAGLVAFVISVLFRNGASVAMGLAGVAVAVAGGWWVITERMPRRAIGIAGVVVGLIAVVIALINALDGADRIALRIVAFAALLALTMICGRAAMAREIHQLDLHVRAGGPPKHPVLLCNPWSGGGKVARFGLRDLATELGVETVMLDRDLDLEQLAAECRGARR